MREVVLTVNGTEYRGWKEIRITRSLESLCGSFSMSVSERWEGQTKRWPILEGDECVVRLGDEPIITGYVDTREMSLSASEHRFSVSGRDRAADLIDCSAVLEAWEFNGMGVLEIAQRVAKPFGIEVTMQPGLAPPPAPPRIVINPGESAFDVIERACRLAGLFAISDGQGNVILTQAGSAPTATPIIEGQNILEASAQYDASACYRQYIVIGQQQGGDPLFGTLAADVRAEALDQNVKRASRVLMIRAEGSVTIQQAQDRVNWEAAVRHARALEIRATVQGWEQADSTLWPVNAKVMIEATVLGVRGELLISEVVYSLSQGGGTTTELTLRPPDAFLPQPEIPKNTGGTVLELEDE
jgi:prophage tail gpP-like protein